MDVRWLTVDEQELEAAIEELDKASRPKVQPRGGVGGGISLMLLFAFFGIVWFRFAGSIDAEARPRVPPSAVGELVVGMVVVVLWCYVMVRVSRRFVGPRRDSEVRAWREHLTGLANDVVPEPVNRATFVSLITGERRLASCRPRFVAPGVEFGNLEGRTYNELEWHYLATQLPAPLPHLILESASAGSLPRELPRADIGQALSLGQPFDRAYRLYAPQGYAHDALFVLTPAVMAVLLDHAADFHIETIGDTLVFFTPRLADFTEPEPWHAINALWRTAVPAIWARAERYRDERVAEQALPHRLSSFREALETPGATWQEDTRRIAVDGKRLARRRRGTRWSMAPMVIGHLALAAVMITVTSIGSLGFLMALMKLYEAFFG